MISGGICARLHGDERVGVAAAVRERIVPEDLLSNKYGHRIHFWDLRARRNVRPSISAPIIKWRWKCARARPRSRARFLGVVVDTSNLEGSIWTWCARRKFHIEKTATIPAEPAPKEQLPPLLQGFGAVPPLVTDIDLSMDDRFLYVACWARRMRQYDVSEPRSRTCGLGAHRRHRSPHAAPERQAICRRPADGGDQPRRNRVYWTNSLYSTWDNQFYPDGIPGAEVHGPCKPGGGLALAGDYWVGFPDATAPINPARRRRLLDDSFCYPSLEF